jgi:hypothetical protein
MSLAHMRHVIMVGVLLGAVTPLLAQTRTSTAQAPIRIRKLEGNGSRTRVMTPFFNTDQDRGAMPAREWYRLNLIYDTAIDWIDELTIKFHVIAQVRTESGPAFSLYRKTVRYRDIKEGRNHRAVVFLRPQQIERYGEVVAAAVEVTLQNKEGQQFTLTEADNGMELPEKWWSNPQVTESRAVTIRDGLLLDRNQSPWALINMDDYEVIK